MSSYFLKCVNSVSICPVYEIYVILYPVLFCSQNRKPAGSQYNRGQKVCKVPSVSSDQIILYIVHPVNMRKFFAGMIKQFPENSSIFSALWTIW